jgi:hypothetical protein
MMAALKARAAPRDIDPSSKPVLLLIGEQRSDCSFVRSEGSAL